jgi:hypothetical protein
MSVDVGTDDNQYVVAFEVLVPGEKRRGRRGGPKTKR